MRGQVSMEFIAVISLLFLFTGASLMKAYQFSRHNLQLTREITLNRECLLLEEQLLQTYLLGEGGEKTLHHTLRYDTEIYGDGVIYLDGDYSCPIPANIVEDRTLPAGAAILKLRNINESVEVQA